MFEATCGEALCVTTYLMPPASPASSSFRARLPLPDLSPNSNFSGLLFLHLIMHRVLASSRTICATRVALQSSDARQAFHIGRRPALKLFSNPQIRFLHSFTNPKASSQIVPDTTATDTTRDYQGRLRDVAIAIPILFATSSLGLYCYYRSFFEEVPITKRKRMLWEDAEYDEAVSIAETWMSTPQKPIFTQEAPPAIMIQKILNRLLEVELAKNLVVKLYISEEPNSHALNGMNGGRIFIDTGAIIQCQNPEEVAGILAHELGHIVARHTVERSTGHFFAEYVARLFGFQGPLGIDLVTSRMHEKEADHIGLMLMAEAGIDPQARIEHVERLSMEEKLALEGREPMPEFLSTHPTNENRVKFMKAVLHDAKALFERRQKAPLVVEEWEKISQELIRRRLATVPALGFAADLRQDQVLPAIVGELSRIAEAIVELKARLDTSSGGVTNALEDVTTPSTTLLHQRETQLHSSSREAEKPEEMTPPTTPLNQQHVLAGMQDAKTTADRDAAREQAVGPIKAQAVKDSHKKVVDQ
ncbi:hypothetical protein BDZ45DRAFT_726228 [Acephala macrosclerotiorum]|nr:hypothetical protein BDZ45DRAFT_726228 [Acephala macrosclerotiorum]